MASRCCGPNGPDTIPTSRRDMLSRGGFGFGMLALASMLQQEGLLAAEPGIPNSKLRFANPHIENLNPLAPKRPHYEPKAKSIIFLFMSGGPSHLETWDPKPDLQRLHGQPLPASFGPVKTRRGVDKNRLLGTKRTFAKQGQSGIEVSDFLPETAKVVDDLAVIRSCYGDSVTHPESVYLMNTGSIRMGKPSLGSWLAYGLGSENQEMPAFVCMPDPKGIVKGGAPSWGAGFLPAAYQGTVFRGNDRQPISYLDRPAGVTAEQSRSTLDFIQALNREHLRHREEDSALAARIAAYELAFRMQTRAAEIVDISRESEATKQLYGLDQEETADFGRRCLLARRMVERGVRCVQVYCGDADGWDGHADVEFNHRIHCERSDKPCAALIQDLKQRGMLDDTLVVWGGEFGRTPMSEGSSGRDHNPYGFSMWLAGGGVKGGVVHGSTDAVGLRAETDRVHVHDLHATILHLLGLNHKRLTYLHNGRAERLTDVSGEVVKAILA